MNKTPTVKKFLPVDIVARMRQNEDLTRLVDENIALISATLSLERGLTIGDEIELEGIKYVIKKVKDSRGLSWIYPVKMEIG